LRDPQDGNRHDSATLLSPLIARPHLTVLVCHCACPDADTARRIAERLVEERLAACASVLPGMHSVYRWQGQVERADEVLLLIKTSRERLPALTERVLALHPYELPELVAVEAAGGSPAWLDWVVTETAWEPASE
jgi:periplasmic divalent cation tolerance protein